MKNFLFLFLLSFTITNTVSAQCVMETSVGSAFVPAGETGTVTAVLKSFDVIAGTFTPMAATADWTITCTGCASFSVDAGGTSGAAGVLVNYVADVSGTLSISFGAEAAGSCPMTSSSFVQSILPIELAYFKGAANDSDVNLNWLTTMEFNNDFFTVERSFDGKEFTGVSKLTGAGDSEEEVSYDFTDENVTRIATANTVYYRLKQTDFDGKFTYSDIISVDLENRAELEVTNVAIAGNELSVNFVAPTEGTTEISVYDMTGRMIATNKEVSTEGYNTTNLDLNTNQSGIFVVRITNGQTQTVRKIMK